MSDRTSPPVLCESYKNGRIMDDRGSIPVRDEQVQQDNSDKTASAMEGVDPASGRERTEDAAGEEPSGYRGENPATSGSGSTRVQSETPENAMGRLNPSAPGDTGTTPGSTAE